MQCELVVDVLPANCRSTVHAPPGALIKTLLCTNNTMFFCNNKLSASQIFLAILGELVVNGCANGKWCVPAEGQDTGHQGAVNRLQAGKLVKANGRSMRKAQ